MALELDVKNHIAELPKKKEEKKKDKTIKIVKSIKHFYIYSFQVNQFKCCSMLRFFKEVQGYTTYTNSQILCSQLLRLPPRKKTPLNEAMQFGFQYIKLENSNHESNCREQISSKYRIQIVSSLKRLMLIKYT